MGDSRNDGEGNLEDEEEPSHSSSVASCTTGGIMLGSGLEDEDEHEAVPILGNYDDSSDDEMLAHFLFVVCRSYILNQPQQRIPQMTWVAKLLNGSETQFYNALRMTKPCFRALVDELTTRGRLTNTPQERLSVEEKVAIFLRTVADDQASHRQHRVRFQHSTETVNRAINQVLKALMRIASTHVTAPDYANTSSQVLNDPRFYPYFKDVVGVMDGSLIPTWVPEEEQRRSRSRKRIPSHNVLAICDLDGVFTYVYAGWEGNAFEPWVLSDAILNDSYFPWPPEGKVYLVDDGYCNSECFLAPYTSTPYHLQDTGVHPTTPHDLFNLRHSQLRNVVERCFGMLKSRFPVLKYGMPRYSMPIQVKMVIACCVVHNFIRRFGMADPIFDGNHDGIDVDSTLHSSARRNVARRTIDEQSQRRDEIAEAMWQNRGIE